MESIEQVIGKDSTDKLLHQIRPLPAFDIQFVEVRIMSDGKYMGKRFHFWHASTFQIELGGRNSHRILQKALMTRERVASIVWQDGRFLLLPEITGINVNGAAVCGITLLRNGDLLRLGDVLISIRLEAIAEDFGNLRLKPVEEKVGGLYDGLKRFCRSFGIMRADDTV